MARLNRNEKQMRVLQVADSICKGTPTKQIIFQCMETWGIRERMAEKYVQSAYESLASAQEGEDLCSKKAKALAMREHLYKKALAEGDVKTALQTLDSMAKINGLFVDQAKVEHGFGDTLFDIMAQANNGEEDTTHLKRTEAISGQNQK